MQNCPYCQNAIEPTNPVLLVDKIEKALKNEWHFAEEDSQAYYWAWPVGKKFDISGVGEAEVVAKKIKADASEFETGYYDGGSELPQGTTFETYVVLKVGEHFFKKTGHGDSYSEVVWNGPLRPVTPKTETRVVYTFG